MPGDRFFKVKVQAGARRESLIERDRDSYEIHVKAPAERGQANAAVLNCLAHHLGIPVGKLWIVKGAQSPSKIIRLLA